MHIYDRFEFSLKIMIRGISFVRIKPQLVSVQKKLS